MPASHSEKSVEQIVADIEALDLGPIKFKATCKEDGHGWSAAYADRVEIAYRRYLILHAKYPSVLMAPQRDVDRFWHLHILDTRKYARDCEATFGHFLHHFPYLGLRGEDDARLQQHAADVMQRLYVSEFGEALPGGQEEGVAWCALEGERTDVVASAWCALEGERKGVAGAAWCALEGDRKDVVASAWCALERGHKQGSAAAWCALEGEQRIKAGAAWCALDARPGEQASRPSRAPASAQDA